MKVFKFIICTIIGIILFLLLNRYSNGFTVGAPWQISREWWRNVGRGTPDVQRLDGFNEARVFATRDELMAYFIHMGGFGYGDISFCGQGQQDFRGNMLEVNNNPDFATAWEWNGERPINVDDLRGMGRRTEGGERARQGAGMAAGAGGAAGAGMAASLRGPGGGRPRLRLAGGAAGGAAGPHIRRGQSGAWARGYLRWGGREEARFRIQHGHEAKFDPDSVPDPISEEDAEKADAAAKAKRGIDLSKFDWENKEEWDKVIAKLSPEEAERLKYERRKREMEDKIEDTCSSNMNTIKSELMKILTDPSGYYRTFPFSQSQEEQEKYQEMIKDIEAILQRDWMRALTDVQERLSRHKVHEGLHPENACDLMFSGAFPRSLQGVRTNEHSGVDFGMERAGPRVVRTQHVPSESTRTQSGGQGWMRWITNLHRPGWLAPLRRSAGLSDFDTLDEEDIEAEAHQLGFRTTVRAPFVDDDDDAQEVSNPMFGAGCFPNTGAPLSPSEREKWEKEQEEKGCELPKIPCSGMVPCSKEENERFQKSLKKKADDFMKNHPRETSSDDNLDEPEAMTTEQDAENAKWKGQSEPVAPHPEMTEFPIDVLKKISDMVGPSFGTTTAAHRDDPILPEIFGGIFMEIFKIFMTKLTSLLGQLGFQDIILFLFNNIVMLQPDTIPYRPNLAILQIISELTMTIVREILFEGGRDRFDDRGSLRRTLGTFYGEIVDNVIFNILGLLYGNFGVGEGEGKTDDLQRWLSRFNQVMPEFDVLAKILTTEEGEMMKKILKLMFDKQLSIYWNFDEKLPVLIIELPEASIEKDSEGRFQTLQFTLTLRMYEQWEVWNMQHMGRRMVKQIWDIYHKYYKSGSRGNR